MGETFLLTVALCIIGAFDFEKWKDSLKTDKLLIANFPNRFLAIVPDGRAKDIAKECQEAIGKAIDELLEKGWFISLVKTCGNTRALHKVVVYGMVRSP